MTSSSSYAERLGRARRIVAALRAAPDPPIHLQDQAQAARATTAHAFDRLSQVLPALDPGIWSTRDLALTTADEALARTMAATAGFTSCPHLPPDGLPPPDGPLPPPAPAQLTGPVTYLTGPVYVRLAIRRLDCPACLSITRTPPPEDEDRCDWCGNHGITAFYPLTFAMGTWLVYGDACRDCRIGLFPDLPARH